MNAHRHQFVAGSSAMANLTKSEKAILRAIDAAPDKVLDFYESKEAAGLTWPGFRRVTKRMEDRRLIARAVIGSHTITFAGMQAIKAREAA